MLLCRRFPLLLGFALSLASPGLAQDAPAPPDAASDEAIDDEAAAASGAEPSGVEASGVEPSAVEPSAVEPRAVEPSAVEPSAVEPSAVEPSAVEPSAAEPSDAEPNDAEPNDAEPNDAEPNDGFAHREELTTEHDPADGEAPVGSTNPADAGFMTLAAAVGSGGGLLAVAATSFVSTYIVTNIFRIGGFTFTARYWRWGALGVIPVVASLAAIPIGAALGIWWGAGLRGLPLPLVDALALMVLGISLGTLSGALIGGPAGFIGGSFLGGMLLLNGSFDYIVWFNGWNVALAWAFVGVPLIAMASGALLGGVVGAAAGPVLTGTQWGLGAKASYFEE